MALDLTIGNVANTLAGAGVQAGGSTTATATKADTTPIGSTSLDPGVSKLVNSAPAQASAPLGPAPLPVSTTTLSTANKQAQVPKIQQTTQTLADTGVRTDANGNPTFANGTIATAPPAPKTYVSADFANTHDMTNPAFANYVVGNPSTNPDGTPATTTTSGGYNGEVYVPPGSPIPKDANGNPVNLTPTSPTEDTILKGLNDAKASADALTATIIDSITKQYQGLIEAQKQANLGAEGKVNTALLIGGVTGQGSSSQYAPISSAGIIQSQVSYGLGQIADLQNKEQMAILQAQQAGQNQDFQLQDKINTQIQNIRDEKVAAATKLNDAVTAAKSQTTLDNAVTKLYTSGITDAASVAAALSKQGLVDPTTGQPYTSDSINKSLTAIKPTADELNRSQAAIKFALDNGITKPFYLVGNTAIDSKTGLPVSLAQYQAATGQTGKTEAQTDFSQIQKAPDPQVQALIIKYPDANILPTDSLQQATSKLQNSSIYKKDTYIAGTGGSGGPYVPGADPVTDSWVQNILNGAATLANVPAAYKNAVSVAMNSQSTTSYTPLAASRFTTAANKIVSNFVDLPAYKLTAGGQLYLGRIAAAMQTPGSISDQDLLDSLTKLNTGGNAISDAQVRLITDGKSLSDWANVLSNKLGTGGVLSDTQRNQIQQLAQNIFSSYQKAYQPVYDQATSQLQAAGIPKAFWTIPDLNTLTAKADQTSNPKSLTPDQLKANNALYTPAVNKQIWSLAQPKGISADDLTKLSSEGYSPDELTKLINDYNSSGGPTSFNSVGNTSASTDPNKAVAAIGQYESGGNYKAIGPKTSSGDVAYGKYQVMGTNIPSWTKEALGYSMTPQQFLNDPKAQDAVANYKIGNLAKQGNSVEDIASIWFTGQPLSSGANKTDVNKTSGSKYAANIRAIYNKLG